MTVTRSPTALRHRCEHRYFWAAARTRRSGLCHRSHHSSWHRRSLLFRPSDHRPAISTRGPSVSKNGRCRNVAPRAPTTTDDRAPYPAGAQFLSHRLAPGDARTDGSDRTIHLEPAILVGKAFDFTQERWPRNSSGQASIGRRDGFKRSAWTTAGFRVLMSRNWSS